jgi:restriction endonuclease S subunit
MLGNIHIIIPTLPEQRAIADFLHRETARIDSVKEKVKGMIANLQEYRTALISVAVTGKIDVTSLS